MRLLVLAASAALALSACVASTSGPVTTRALVAADAATALAVGERITEEKSSQPGGEGMDPIVNITLRHADGRRLSFQEGNHTEHDLIAQRPGGALAQIMMLAGEEPTTLYNAANVQTPDGAFFCGPQGPAVIGTYTAPDGVLHLVGLRQPIQFETRPDGVTEAIPYSPDQVCARLRFRPE